MHEEALGRLLLTVTGATRRGWLPWPVWNLFVYERGLAAVRTGVMETIEGPPTLTGWAKEQHNRRLEEAAHPVAKRVRDRPGSRIVSRAEVVAARLHKGVVDVRLVVEVADGSVLRWVWTYGGGARNKVGIPNSSLEHVEAGLRGWLGGKLIVE